MRIILILVLLQCSLVYSYNSAENNPDAIAREKLRYFLSLSLENLFERDLIDAIKSNKTEKIEQVLSHDINSFRDEYPLNSWKYVKSNSDLKKLKNKALHFLVKWSAENNLNIDKVEDILQVLLNNGLDIEFEIKPSFYPYTDDCNWVSMTPLMYAVVIENPKLIKLLINYGANSNEENEQHENDYLLAALSLDRPLSVKTLFEFGTNLYITDENLKLLGNNKCAKLYMEKRKQEILSVPPFYSDVANIINQY